MLKRSALTVGETKDLHRGLADLPFAHEQRVVAKIGGRAVILMEPAVAAIFRSVLVVVVPDLTGVRGGDYAAGHSIIIPICSCETRALGFPGGIVTAQPAQTRGHNDGLFPLLVDGVCAR